MTGMSFIEGEMTETTKNVGCVRVSDCAITRVLGNLSPNVLVWCPFFNPMFSQVPDHSCVMPR